MENLVYHYTTLDALRGILKEDALCLWATHYKHLNDPSEQIWAERNIIKSIQETDLSYKADSHNNMKLWLGKETYIISLCQKRDYRNMWRLYGGDGKGVCLGLNKRKIRNLSRKNSVSDPDNKIDIFRKVDYSSLNTIDDVVRKVINDKAFDVFDFFDEDEANTIMRIAPFIKNDDFRIEDEIRYARIRDMKCIKFSYDPVTEGPSEPSRTENLNGVKYRMRGDERIPYIEIPFPTEILEEIILGYEVDEKETKEYINSLISPFREKYNKKLNVSPSDLYSNKNRLDYETN